ncbi:ABC transporter substrate-binding protein [Mesosutterella sp. AGMB02718]|uniref:ABC transporter substrate-binding protein n=1 Tax=Mesosutterella faecium TaxID=2925194 RepID=A0ABT7INR8_9BURK|nr:ABC transporter substrate-binding protein [Mesosutterella sp. AGMB02718]MDL2060023.1 ABC transporter substrate-binding protein [Mesosutterella sp. AGMB02718]
MTLKISRRVLLSGLAAAFSLGIAFSGVPAAAAPAAGSCTLVDQMHRTVKLPARVNRIVVLQHHSLDILAELGATDRVVGVMQKWDNLLDSSFADIMPRIKTLPEPGSLKSASVEQVAALKPDLVVVSNQMPRETVDRLTALGIPVMAITLYVADKEQASTIHPSLVNPDAAYTEGLKQAIELLARATGTEKRGAELWKTVETNRRIVTSHLKRVPENKRIRVFMANEKGFTYGTGKYVGAAMARAGAKNVAETLKGYKQVTPEQVAAWNPQVIFVQSRYREILDQIRRDPAWKGIDTVKNNRLVLAPDYTKPWGNPAPESMALGEVWLAKTLYPEHFRDVNLDRMVNDFYKKFYGISYKKH